MEKILLYRDQFGKWNVRKNCCKCAVSRRLRNSDYAEHIYFKIRFISKIMIFFLFLNRGKGLVEWTRNDKVDDIFFIQ